VQGFLLIAALMVAFFYYFDKKIDHIRRGGYVCTFNLEIHDEGDSPVPVARLRQKSRHIKLPFPPYPGLYLDTVVVEEDGDVFNFLSGKIERVVWKAASDGDGHFRCNVEGRKLEPQNDLEAVIALYERYGWQRDGPVGGWRKAASAMAAERSAT